ncbi:MAG: hypothetical protein ACTSRS_06450 [Candidatus Helarchaeota archaeon]
MNGLDLVDWTAIILFIIVVIISITIALIFFLKYVHWRERNNNQLAFGILFLCLGIGRSFLIYFDYFLTHLNPAEYENYQIVWKLATLFLLIGLGTLILVSEHAVLEGKDYYIFFIGFAIITCGVMIVPDFILSQTLGTAAIAFAVFIPISYIYLAIKLPPSRKNIALIFTGFIIYGAGLILLSVFLVDPNTIHIVYVISALIQISGLIIFGIGAKRMYFPS